MTPRPFIGAVDLGTSSIKTCIYDEGLELISCRVSKSPLTVSGGSAIQDPMMLREALIKSINRLIDSGVMAVGVSVYRGSVSAWDQKGDPLAPIITWLDTRPWGRHESLGLMARIASRLPGYSSALSPGSPLYSMKMVIDGLGGIPGGVTVWTVDALVYHWLLGYPVADASSAGLTGIINPYTLKPIPLIKKMAGLRGLREPRIVGHERVIVRVRGVPVGPLIADQQAGMIGLGCVSYCVKITLGTGTFVDAGLGGSKPRLLLPRGVLPLIVYRGPRRRLYGIEGFIPGTGIIAESVARLVGGFEKLDSAVYKAREASLLFPFPYGSRIPYSPWARPIAILPPRPDEASLASGLVLGLAMATYSIYTTIRRVVGDTSRVIVDGGLSRLGSLRRVIAGLVGGSVEVFEEPSSPARGAAIVAGIASGLLDEGQALRPPASIRTIRSARPKNVMEVEESWRTALNALASENSSKRLRRLLDLAWSMARELLA